MSGDDDDLVFTDDAEEARRPRPRPQRTGAPPPRPGEPATDPKPRAPRKQPTRRLIDTQEMTPEDVRALRGHAGGPIHPATREPPAPQVATLPHCLLAPVLPEPHLLSRSAPCVIGRDRSADIRIATDQVSRGHAEVRWDGKRFVVCDIGSTNGTLLNGHPLKANAPVPIHDEDRIEAGGIEITVQVLRPGELPPDLGEGPTKQFKLPRPRPPGRPRPHPRPGPRKGPPPRRPR